MSLNTLMLGPDDADAVVFLFHGFGADAHDLAGLVPELALPETDRPGVRFVLPDAPVIRATIAGGMPVQAWYDIKTLEPSPNREDAEGIRTTGVALAELVAAEEAKGVASERIVLAGFSQGGAMALYTGLRYPRRLAGIVGMSTYLVLPETLAAEAAAANRDTPVWMGHGTIDDVVPMRRGEAAREALRAEGWSVGWQTWRMGHAIHPGEVAALREWLGERLA